MATDQLLVFLRANISDFQAKMGAAGKEVETLSAKGAGVGSKLAAIGKAVALGGAVAAVGFGAYAVKQANEFDEAQARLKTAVADSGLNFGKYAKQFDAAETAGRKLNFSSATTATSLAALTVATKDPAAAVKLLSTAENVAAARNIDLASATKIVTKAHIGQTGALRRMGIDLPIATSSSLKLQTANEKLATATQKLTSVQGEIASGQLKGKAASDALAKANDGVFTAQKNVNDASNAGTLAIDALNKRYGGSAQAQAKTFTGQLKQLGIQFQQVAVEAGTVLIPFLQKLLVVIQAGIKWFSQHKTVAAALAIIIGGVLVAALVAATAAWIAETAAAIAALGPIGLVIASILALIAIAVLLYTNWNTVWNFMKNNPAIAGVIAAIALVTAPITFLIFAAVLLAKNWDAIWKFCKDVVSGFVAFFTPIALQIAAVIQAVVALVTDIIHGNWVKAWDDAKAIVVLAFALIWAGIQAAWGLIGGFVSSLPGKILGFLASLPGLLLSLGLRAFSAILQGGLAVIGDLYGWVSGIPGGIAHALVGIGSLLVSAGSALIHGLISGITSAGGAVAGAVKNVVSGAVNAAKSFLGINSPSTVFMEIGSNVSKGMELGILGGQSGVHRAIGGLNGKPGSTLAAAGSSLSNIPGGPAAQGARGGDTYQVTINAMSQNPEDLVDAFARYVRKNGNGGIQKLVGV